LASGFKGLGGCVGKMLGGAVGTIGGTEGAAQAASATDEISNRLHKSNLFNGNVRTIFSLGMDVEYKITVSHHSRQ
jgi:hypothetical protein